MYPGCAWLQKRIIPRQVKQECSGSPASCGSGHCRRVHGPGWPFSSTDASYGQDYIDIGEACYEDRFRQRRLQMLLSLLVSNWFHSQPLELRGCFRQDKKPNGTGSTRVAGVLRMAAVSLKHSKTALGAAFRRKARHKGWSVAVFSMARR